ncbi:MAG: HAMP domain-containing histidine kinase [Spirochaetes bacterium]|nr:HAMP domain-containing histidine kinase [Spirochaetota bacterium]
MNDDGTIHGILAVVRGRVIALGMRIASLGMRRIYAAVLLAVLCTAGMLLMIVPPSLFEPNMYLALRIIIAFWLAGVVCLLFFVIRGSFWNAGAVLFVCASAVVLSAAAVYSLLLPESKVILLCMIALTAAVFAFPVLETGWYAVTLAGVLAVCAAGFIAAGTGFMPMHLLGTAVVIAALTLWFVKWNYGRARQLVRETPSAPAAPAVQHSPADLKSSGEMAARIFHDLRTPLSIIKGYVDIIAVREGQLPQDKYREIAKVLADQTEVMNRLANDVRWFSQDLLVQRFSANVALLIRTAARAVKEDHGVSVSGGTEVTCMLDPVLMERALSMIIGFMLQQRNEPVAITAAVSVSGLSCEIILSDNGPGFTPDICAKLFEPFFNAGRKRLGLGLAVVKKIVVAHGGTIHAESACGAGTKICITLPVSAAV